MPIQSQSAIHFSVVQLSEIMNRCFQGYSIPVSVTPGYFATRFTAEGLSLNDSCVWTEGDQLVAIALITRRAQAGRLAAFALTPEYRGKGLSRPLLHPLLNTLSHQGINPLSLEVISTNRPGIALYTALNFTVLQTLYGFKGTVSGECCSPPLAQGTHDELLRALYTAPAVPLPWQLSPLSWHHFPCEIVHNQHAWAVISTYSGAPLLHMIFVEPGYRNEGRGTGLLQQLRCHYPEIRTPVAIPAAFQPLFLKAGYTTLPVTQLEMCYDQRTRALTH